MSASTAIRRQIAAAIAAICACLALASTASAVDLRDWGRKFPASQRFVVLSQFNNEAVLDKETQPIWQREHAGVNDFQRYAANYCISRRIGNRMGWRLPTVAELSSLLDTGASGSTKLPVGHPFKSYNGFQGGFWTTTQLPRRSGDSLNYEQYYVVHISTGGATHESEFTYRNFLCVRGPE